MDMFHSHPSLSKLLFSFLLIFTVVLSWLARLSGAGWYLVFLGIPLLIMTILHIGFHLYAIVKIPEGKLRVIAQSHLFFFFFLTLQYDGADTKDSVGISLYFFMHSFGIELKWLNHPLISLFSYVAIALLIFSWHELRTSTRASFTKSSNEESIEDYSKLTYRQKFVITEYGYLLSPEKAEVVGNMLGNLQDNDVLPFCQANGKKISDVKK